MSAEPSRPLYDGRCYDIGESVAHQIVRLVAMLRREADGRMAALGLTDAQWKPLWFVHVGRATTPNELAREMDVDGGAVTRLLDRLESKGLLARTRSEADRRVVRLALTEAGRAAAEQIPPVLASVNNDFLRGFSADDWQQLRGLLDRLLVNGEAMQGPHAVPAAAPSATDEPQ